MIQAAWEFLDPAAGEPDGSGWPAHLAEALSELLEGDGDDRERLARAAASFRVALTAYPNWPADLRAAADALRAKLTTGGCFEATIDRMDERRLREASNDLWRFCQIGLAAGR